MSNFDEIKRKYPELIMALANAAKKKHLAHAFLIQGDMAASRNNFALALAQIACCPEKRKTANLVKYAIFAA